LVQLAGSAPLKPSNRMILLPATIGSGSQGVSTPSPSVSGCAGGREIGHGSQSLPSPSASSSNWPPGFWLQKSALLSSPSPSTSPSSSMQTGSPPPLRLQML
jgi:hypothetical protein